MSNPEDRTPDPVIPIDDAIATGAADAETDEEGWRPFLMRLAFGFLIVSALIYVFTRPTPTAQKAMNRWESSCANGTSSDRDACEMVTERHHERCFRAAHGQRWIDKVPRRKRTRRRREPWDPGRYAECLDSARLDEVRRQRHL